MVVCKYFLEGRCRFGDRCFNEHIFTESKRYPTYQRPDSPNTASNFSFNEARQFRPNYNNSYYENNPYQWTASKYDDPYYAKSSRHNRHYESPKESPVQSSSNRFEALRNVHDETENKSDEKNRNLVKSTVIEDVISWEKGGMWPFTCYGPVKSKPAIPGLEDISPEELRYKAYEARKNNTFPAYVKHVTEALQNVNKQRDLLKRPTAEIITLINSINAEETTNVSDKFSNTNAGKATKVLFGKLISDSDPPQSLSSTQSSGFFTLGHLLSSKSESSDMESMNEDVPRFFGQSNTQASSFKFVLPTEQEKKLVASEDLKEAHSLYTPTEKLSREEVEAFSAATFTLGKIPTRPPARTMCF